LLSGLVPTIFHYYFEVCGLFAILVSLFLVRQVAVRAHFCLQVKPKHKH